MGRKSRIGADLCENDCLPIQDNGWKDINFGAGAKVWTVEKLRVAMDEYFAWTNATPLPKDMKLSEKVGGKNGDTNEDTKRKVVRPYNMKSMCARVGIADWEKFKARYCNDSTEEGQEMTELCMRIENFVHGNLQEGATAGIYNAKIVMGMTNVAEHVKQEVSGFDNMSDDELKEYRDSLLVQTGAGKE